MADKRKRKRCGSGIDTSVGGATKRQRILQNPKTKDAVVKDAVLAQYYPKVVSLREYLVSKLPPTSKIRKKKILSFGKNFGSNREENEAFSKFLDQTIIGVRNYQEISPQERTKQWSSFSQRIDTSDSTFANLTGVGLFSQAEVSSLVY